MSIKNCLKKEIENLKTLAEQENLFAQFMLGFDENEKVSTYWSEKAAWQGFAPAQYNLGVRYYYGDKAPQNYELALEWFQKATMQGFAPAQNNLAIIYRKGTKQNYELALELFQKAAMQGYALAQFNLGTMHYNGEGTKQNDKIAFGLAKKIC